MSTVGQQLEINYKVAKLTEEESKKVFDKIRAELNQVTKDKDFAEIPYNNVILMRCVRNAFVERVDGTLWYLDKSDDYNRVLQNICVHRSKWIKAGYNPENKEWRNYLASSWTGTQLAKDVTNYNEGGVKFEANKVIYNTYKLLEIRYNDLRLRDDIARDNYGVARINTGKALADWTRWKEANMTPEELAGLDPDVFKGSFIDVFSWKTVGIGFGILIIAFGIFIYIKRR